MAAENKSAQHLTISIRFVNFTAMTNTNQFRRGDLTRISEKLGVTRQYISNCHRSGKGRWDVLELIRLATTDQDAFKKQLEKTQK